jgi:esterase/lipase
MSSPNYLERISKDAKEKDVAAKKSAAKKAAINVKAAVFQAEADLNEANEVLEEIKSAEPFEINSYLDAVSEQKDAQETYDALKTMEKELFSGLAD